MTCEPLNTKSCINNTIILCMYFYSLGPIQTQYYNIYIYNITSQAFIMLVLLNDLIRAADEFLDG